MALNLPYPNLDFVPLDILTADEMNEIVANYTYIANQFPIGPSNLDWSNIALGTEVWSLSDGGHSGYADNANNGWSGFNFSTSGTVSGPATAYAGSSAQGAAGGGVKLTSAAPTGLYLVTVELEGSEAASDGTRPYRITKNTSGISGDLGVPFRGGSASTTRIVELTADDVISVQIFTTGSSDVCSCRVWMKGYFIKPTS